MKNKNLLKFGNAKLSNDTMVFNLPAVKTCGRHCPGCYALKPELRYKTVKVSRARKYSASLKCDFVERISAEVSAALAKGKVRFVRIHESGDFYSPEYVSKWEKIAKAFPLVTFYGYTKRLDGSDKNRYIDQALQRVALLPNFIIMDSLMYGTAINYGTRSEVQPAIDAGAFLCPCRKGDARKLCGVSCTYCMEKKAQAFAPVFIKH